MHLLAGMHLALFEEPASLTDMLQGWGTVAGVIVAAAALLLGIQQNRRGQRAIRAAKEDPATTLKRRIERVTLAFVEAAELMDELQRDLEAQQAVRQALIAKAEEQQQLLAVNEEQAEKIRQILVSETKSNLRAEQRREWMFAALGLVMSIPIGILINLIT
ncbi:hypothetical protein ACOZ38_25340 [Sphaerisporangium viridialbum]|uniref:hypothetical protein n=1 Tax=Sphaerisporangium viridialbum TaxID=46189 RepID=UPI003C71ACC6